MSSIARKQRRGKVDQFGRPIPKRLYNNKKRTKGRQKQEIVKQHHIEMVNRLKYIRQLIVNLVKNKEKLTEENWVEIIRKYDKHQIYFDDYEKKMLFHYVNMER